MALTIDLRASLRSSHRLDDLVASIYNADTTTTPETHWVEWKSALDFTTPKGKFTAAKAIIAFANRDPANAARECAGEAYLVVGASTNQVLDGATLYDNADLEGMLKAYVDGPHWDADYVQLRGKHVLVITVAPPAPGDRIHSLVKEYDNYPSGTVFRRGVSRSAPATHRELNELQNRLQQNPPVSDADVFTGAIDGGNHPAAGRVIRSTTRSVIDTCSDTEQFPLTFTSRERAGQINEYVAIADRYLAATAPLLTLIVEGCRIESAMLDREWRHAMTALAEPRPLPPAKGSLITGGRDERLEALALLPATLTMYAGAIAAVEHDNYKAVKALTVDGKVSRSIWRQGAKVTILEKAGPWELAANERYLGLALRAAQQDQLTPEMLAALSSGNLPRARYPVSAYLHDALRPHFSDHTDTLYTELFDTAEIICSLIATDLAAQGTPYLNEPWLGLFVIHAADTYPFEQSIAAQILTTAANAGDQWPPVRAGLFQESADRMHAAVKSVWNATLQQGRRGPY